MIRSTLQNKTNSDEWQIRYAFDKIIPQLLKDGFDAEDIIKYLTIKVYENINKVDNINVEAEEIKA